MGIEADSVCTNNYFVAVFCPFLFSLTSFCASQRESFYRAAQEGKDPVIFFLQCAYRA